MTIPLNARRAGAAGRFPRARSQVVLAALAFLSIDGLYRAMGDESRNPLQPQYTDHCFTGDYPTKLTDLAVATPRRLAVLAEAD